MIQLTLSTYTLVYKYFYLVSGPLGGFQLLAVGDLTTSTPLFGPPFVELT
jgi:hypothetical protein